MKIHFWVKNGIRFPIKFSIREAYHVHSGGIYERSEKTVTCEGYKIFAVDSEVKYGTNLNSIKEIPINMTQIQ